MKKTKNLIILLTLFLSFGMTSCDGFLDEDNKVGQTADLVYNTASGAQGLMASCYSFARGWYGKEAGLGLSEMGTDLFYYGYDNKQKSLCSYNITAESLDGNTADNACLDQYWEMFYCAVDVCNTALKYIPENTAISEALKKQYVGEAYFMRAFYYFHMVNLWGAIPYNGETFTSMVTTATKTSEEEIYGNMLSDLDMAIQKLENNKSKADGHADYWAAKALRARTLLYAASWLGATSITSNANYTDKNLYTLAKDEAADIISNGPFSMYNKYSDTWSMANEDYTKNSEAIFGIRYSGDLLTTVNTIPYRYKTDASGAQLSYNGLITRTGYTRGGSAMLLMFVGMWNNGASDLGNDGTKSTNVFVRVLGASTDTIHSKKTGLPVRVSQAYSPYGRGFTRYLPSLYLWKLLDRNRATDQRTEATLLDHYDIASPDLSSNAAKYPNLQDTAIYYCPLDGNSPEGIAKQAWAKNRYRIQFMSGGDIPIYTTNDPATAKPTETAVATSAVYGDNRYNSYKIGGWCSFPGIKKFLDNVYDPTYPTNDISGRDAFVLRLAEMYLIKAEGELATGGDALGTINALRAKRAISGKDNSISGPVTIDVILDERAIELCGEQQRWFDLKRTHKLIERVDAYNAQGSANIKDFQYYRPIPQAQLDAVTNKGEFLQNTGYN
ncbi:MAG: RagB/SusD family nutrient uptake outer membrane protein [Paludibacter sp.]